MLTVKQGDLFSGLVGRCIIAHGCNAQGVMGSGFALSVRGRYQRAYDRYMGRAANLKLGQVIPSFGREDEHIIINCITQEFYGRDAKKVYVDYEAVRECMWKVAQTAKDFNNLPVHIPMIGGGLANGDHNILMAIFEDAFRSTNATLWLY